MSEYQYYEFQAIDRPLDEPAMADLRSISSRATITPTSLVNVYHYGDFKGRPEQLMERYFDAHLYLANWGSHRLMLRMPAATFPLAAAGPYCTADVFDAREAGGHVILDFQSNDEGGGDYEGGEGWLGSLIPLRADLMAGDMRCLYIAWLAGIHEDEPDEEEPPVPPGLGRLSGALRRFADYLRVDEALLDAAAAGSEDVVPGGSAEELTAWVVGLPPRDKDDCLVRVIRGEGTHVGAELMRRYREGLAAPPADRRRKVGELLALADAAERDRERREAERVAREREKKAAAEAAARALELDSLAGLEEDLWRRVEEAASLKQAAPYDRAVELLRDLRDLAARSGEAEAFAARVRALRERHASKRTFLGRLTRAGLSG